MPGILRPQSPASVRQACLRRIRTALQPTPADSFRQAGEQERLVFVREQLHLVAASVEATALAWEQRGYWAKADGFRREWSWIESAREDLHAAIQAETPAAADSVVASLLVRLIQLGVELQAGSHAGGRSQSSP